MSLQNIPAWAQELKEFFCSNAVSQFLIYGNIFDVVHYKESETTSRFLSLKDFLEHVMLEKYDTVIFYDRGNGIRVTQGDKEWSEWLAQLGSGSGLDVNTRDPSKALKLIDTYLLRALNFQAIGARKAEPNRRKIATFLVTEKLNDVNRLIAENSHTAKIEIKLPSEEEMLDYMKWLSATTFQELEKQSDVGLDVLAKYLTGLSCVAAKNIISFALKNNYRIKQDFLRKRKKDVIEKECQGLLEFYESTYNLDMVAGHEPIKAWLRQDAELLRTGKIHALPMGYLIAGRIGTGKTFLVQCWAGELGIPCVVLKNFRDKWVGTTESNLEKIFSILYALGQVVVFVDEADQITGKRDSGSTDSGLSGRIYAMLAKEMSETKNRGKIIWVFATSRPDLLEVDLKRPGRLDVHFPLFPPQTEKEYRDLFLGISKKLKYPMDPKDIPHLPKGAVYSGNEIEGIMVRALRVLELEKEPKRSLPEILGGVIKEVKANANTRKLEYMDLVAVRECTDSFYHGNTRVFLPRRLKIKSKL